MDLEILKNQLAGLEEKGTALRAKEALFIKAQGIDETIAKTQKEKVETSEKITTLKQELSTLKDQKREAVESTTTAMIKTMGEILPHGNAVFKAEKSGVFIGWDKTPYDGLSGGEKATFDTALCHALKANILVVEAAEIDKPHLGALLKKLKDHKAQIIVNTWFDFPKELTPENFNIVRLANEN